MKFVPASMKRKDARETRNNFYCILFSDTMKTLKLDSFAILNYCRAICSLWRSKKPHEVSKISSWKTDITLSARVFVQPFLLTTLGITEDSSGDFHLITHMGYSKFPADVWKKGNPNFTRWLMQISLKVGGLAVCLNRNNEQRKDGPKATLTPPLPLWQNHAYTSIKCDS